MRVHRVLTGQLLHVIETHKTCFYTMPVPGQSSLLVVGQGRRTFNELHLYDIETGELLRIMFSCF
jgi:hypothetical protein